MGQSEKTSKGKITAVERRRDHAKNKTRKCLRIYEYKYLIKDRRIFNKIDKSKTPSSHCHKNTQHFGKEMIQYFLGKRSWPYI